MLRHEARRDPVEEGRQRRHRMEAHRDSVLDHQGHEMRVMNHPREPQAFDHSFDGASRQQADKIVVSVYGSTNDVHDPTAAYGETSFSAENLDKNIGDRKRQQQQGRHEYGPSPLAKKNDHPTKQQQRDGERSGCGCWEMAKRHPKRSIAASVMFFVLAAAGTALGAIRPWENDDDDVDEDQPVAGNLRNDVKAKPGTPVTLKATISYADGSDGAAIDPSTLTILQAISQDGATSLTVTGGTWSVDQTKGEITFTPELDGSGKPVSTDDPLPIFYVVQNAQTRVSTPGTVIVQYDFSPPGTPRATNLKNTTDAKPGTPVTLTAKITYADNASGPAIDSSTLVISADEGGAGVTSFNVTGGIWSVDQTKGTITYTPKLNANKDPVSRENPSAIFYRVGNDQKQTATEAIVEVSYDWKMPPPQPMPERKRPIAQNFLLDPTQEGSVDLPAELKVDIYAGAIPADDDDAIDETSVLIYNVVIFGGPKPVPMYEGPVTDANGDTIGHTKVTVPDQGVWEVIDDPADSSRKVIGFTKAANLQGDPHPIQFTIADAKARRSLPALIALDKAVSDASETIAALGKMDDDTFWKQYQDTVLKDPQDGKQTSPELLFVINSNIIRATESLINTEYAKLPANDGTPDYLMTLAAGRATTAAVSAVLMAWVGSGAVNGSKLYSATGTELKSDSNETKTRLAEVGKIPYGQRWFRLNMIQRVLMAKLYAGA